MILFPLRKNIEIIIKIKADEIQISSNNNTPTMNNNDNNNNTNNNSSNTKTLNNEESPNNVTDKKPQINDIIVANNNNNNNIGLRGKGTSQNRLMNTSYIISSTPTSVQSSSPSPCSPQPHHKTVVNSWTKRGGSTCKSSLVYESASMSASDELRNNNNNNINPNNSTEIQKLLPLRPGISIPTLSHTWLV